MDKLYYSKKRWQVFLNQCLSGEKELRILYTSPTCKGVPSMFLTKVNEDKCDVVYNRYTDSSFQEVCLKCNYDIILRHFDCSSFSSKNLNEIMTIRRSELDILMELAGAISKEKKKRVSIGFVYFDFEKNYDYDNIYLFYSVTPDGKFIKEDVDMSDTNLCDSDFLGKIIYIHNCLVKQDMGKVFIKKPNVM